VWQEYGVVPERYLLQQRTVHPTEAYYPLRPELAESTFALYQATRDPWCVRTCATVCACAHAVAKPS